MIKEYIKEVDKVWGQELWLVNNALYCGKILLVNSHSMCSYHYHPKKQETFYCLEGFGILTIEGNDLQIAPCCSPKTILPGEKHKFYAATMLVILEISTHHEDEDSIRLEPSVADAFNLREGKLGWEMIEPR